MVKMIRNYQRSSGGGTVDLTPIYNSLNALQNEVNSLITVTNFSTLSSVMADINAMSASIDSLIMSIDWLSMDMQWLSGSVTRISNSVTDVTDSFYDITNSLYSLSTSVTSLTLGYEFMTGSVTYLSSQFQTLYQFVVTQTYSVDTKLRVLEQSIYSNGTKIAELSDNTEAQRLSINSLSSSIVSINGVLSTLSTATGGGGGVGGKTLTNPTESGHMFTDPVLYSGMNITARSNTYMKGVTLDGAVSSNNDITYDGRMTACNIYGDASFINIYSLYLLSASLSNASFKRCSTVRMLNGTADSFDIQNASTISFDACAVNSLSIVSGGSISAYGLSMRQLDLTVDSANLKTNSNADIMNIYCKKALTFESNTAAYMNLSLYINEVSESVTYPFNLAYCSILGANITGIRVPTGIVQGDRVSVQRCTFGSLSMDFWYGFLASNVITDFADLTMNNASLNANTCNGIMAGMFKNLNMTNNSLTVGSLCYLNSAGSGNNIAMAQTIGA